MTFEQLPLVNFHFQEVCVTSVVQQSLSNGTRCSDHVMVVMTTLRTFSAPVTLLRAMGTNVVGYLPASTSVLLSKVAYGASPLPPTLPARSACLCLGTVWSGFGRLLKLLSRQ